jgi:hypothetical protein
MARETTTSASPRTAPRGKRGIPSAEAAFEHWYNGGGGVCRSELAVADHFQVSRSVIRRLRRQYHWDQRAASLDQQLCAETDRRILADRVNPRTKAIEQVTDLLDRFAERLPETISGPEGTEVPNPDYLPPTELTVLDFTRIAKTLLLLAKPLNERAQRVDREAQERARREAGLAEMAARIVELERNTLEIEWENAQREEARPYGFTD